ncbi:MAG: DNA polymerase III subunit beta [Microgenomates group bacterium]
MEIKVNKEEFLKELNLANRFTSSRLSSNTALQGVLLIGEENKLHFYSTNLNFYYHSFLKLDGVGKFKVIVEPKKIIEFLSFLRADKVTVKIKEKSLLISQEKTNGEFALFLYDEFPMPPKITNKKQKIKAEFFRKYLPLLSFAASTDQTRPVLTGINFVSTDEGMELVATDGFRLSLIKIKETLPFASMIVPSNFLSEAMSLLEDEKEVEFSYQEDEKTLVFYLGDKEIYTRLIEGEYPPYQKVIPLEKKTTIVVDSGEFLRNIKLISVFAKETSNIVLIETEKDQIKIYPKTSEKENNITHQEAQIEGEPIKIAFNYRFLIDFLNHTSSKRIIIELLRQDAPAVFKIEENLDFLHIIMPVRIQE